MRKAGKSADVDVFAGLGKIQKFNARGILLDGDSRTGWEHIYKRHVAGTTANRGTTLFPRALGDAQIKNLIMESLEKGTLESTHFDGTQFTHIVQENMEFLRRQRLLRKIILSEHHILMVVHR